ncbi:hypothetical protein M0804_005179 [Polistes exclamans]|nr:hypothetical protein M0804_005179 [Polistes exclamans]
MFPCSEMNINSRRWVSFLVGCTYLRLDNVKEPLKVPARTQVTLNESYNISGCNGVDNGGYDGGGGGGFNSTGVFRICFAKFHLDFIP